MLNSIACKLVPVTLIILLFNPICLKSETESESETESGTDPVPVPSGSASASPHATGTDTVTGPASEVCEAGSEDCSVEPGEERGADKYKAPVDQRGKGYVYRNTRPSEQGHIPQYDPNGYVFFCLCMGMSLFCSCFCHEL